MDGEEGVLISYEIHNYDLIGECVVSKFERSDGTIMTYIFKRYKGFDSEEQKDTKPLDKI